MFRCVFAILLVSTLSVDVDAICRTPFGSLADELPFKDCKPLVDFIRANYLNLTKVQRTFLQRSFINYQQRIVCCDKNFDHKRAFSSVGAEILRNQAGFCGDNTRKRISFGSESTFLAHPWAVLLIYASNLKFECGGTLITNRYILSAAHCIKTSLYGVRVGEHNTDLEIDCEIDEMGEEHCLAPAQDVNIEKVIKHPLYSTWNHDNDIALLRLEKQITFIDSMKPICIPEYQHQNYEKQYGIISGWGATENSTFSKVHREAEIFFTSRDNCQKIYHRRLIDTTKLCTLGMDGKDNCKGDSGGPLYVRLESDNNYKFRYMQVGIISLGTSNCGAKIKAPALYTNIAEYIDWIANSIEL